VQLPEASRRIIPEASRKPGVLSAPPAKDAGECCGFVEMEGGEERRLR